VDNLRELLAEGDIALVKRRLAEVVQEIVVEPARGGQRGGKPRAQLHITGCLARVLALAAEKSKTGGSPGGLSARLILPTRVTFLLQPVHGVRRDRLPEAVKSALRFVLPANPRRYAVAGCFASA
jgi:hypothetical protein